MVDVVRTIEILRRWWFVAIPLIALTVLATVVISDGIQPEFTAEGNVLLVAPSQPDELGSTNPLLDQPTTLATVARLTEFSLASPQVASLLEREGLSTNYIVGVQPGLPIVGVQVRADSRDGATNTVLRLTELIRDDLQLRQEAADVPPGDQVLGEVLTVSSVGGADYGGRTRQRIVVVLLGLGLTVAIAYGLEGLRLRRRASRTDETEHSGDETERSADETEQSADETEHSQRTRLATQRRRASATPAENARADPAQWPGPTSARQPATGIAELPQRYARP